MKLWRVGSTYYAGKREALAKARAFSHRQHPKHASYVVVEELELPGRSTAKLMIYVLNGVHVFTRAETIAIFKCGCLVLDGSTPHLPIVRNKEVNDT